MSVAKERDRGRERVPLRRLMTESAALYRDPGAETARLRAALLAAVLRQTPPAMAANAGCAGVVMWGFWPQWPRGMSAWALAMMALVAVALARWWRGRQRPREQVSVRAVRRATTQAALLAGLWAVPPLAWFPGAGPDQQVQVATVVTGMMGAGAFLLSPLPRACLAYVGIFTVGAVGAMVLDGNPALAGVAVMLAFYASILAFGALSAGRRHAALLRSRADALRQERWIAVLLQDFERHADEALWQCDAQGCVQHSSPRLAQMLGLPEAEIRGRSLVALLGADDSSQRTALQQALAGTGSVRELSLVLEVNGEARHLLLHGERVFDDDGQAQGWRGVLGDATERVLSQQRLHQLAHTDSLTGLANRLTLREALGAALRDGQRGALLSLDLDDFKGINDTLGHTAGDELLRGVAQRLRRCVRPSDLVARLGGDEFAVLMVPSAHVDEAEALARRVVDAIAQTFELQERHLRIGGSVGVTLIGAPGVDVDELLVQADMALYAAKEAGRGRHALYAPSMGERSRRRLAIEQGLRHALQQGELALHWQPKVNLGNWRVIGAEALLRWQPEALGRVAPGEFIIVAEQSGLIHELGRWALQQACAAAAGPLAGLTVSVNVSPVQLQDPDFVALVRDALRAADLPAARLELEITESVFLDDVEGALQRLHALRSLGVRVALDDFGTGYSSLAYLRRFPFDTLKIDRAFVDEAVARKDARAIVRMMVQLAQTLGMRTVCEGVETSQQLAAVAEAGCDVVQGYLVSPPRPLPAFEDLLRHWGRERPAAAASLH